MKITTRLLLAFLAVSVLPLALMAYADALRMQRMRDLAIDESTATLRIQGEAAIHQKAQDVAEQVRLYLQTHPALLTQPPQAWAADPQLSVIAVQPVGKSGYTALYDDQGVVYAHANSKLVGQNMRIMAENFPEFWHVFSASLGGQAVADYYDWPEADGRVRQKYMSCVPVSGSPLRIAATTYIDEFSQPATETGARIDGIFRQARFYQFLALGALALLAIWLALWQAWSLSRPISALTGAAAEIEAGRSPDEPGSRLMALQTVARRRDELGQLGRVFRSMAEQVFAREKHLKQEVQQLRIEIDEARRHQEVKEITESEYFLRLQERVALLRHRHGK